MTHAIEVSALTKTYGEHQVLKGIDLHVRKGEIFALLGVNGAGKTTALECIEGLKKYDSGSITVIGRTGIQLQSSSLPEHIKTMEAIRLFSQWNRSPLPEETLHALGIYEFSKSNTSNCQPDKKDGFILPFPLSEIRTFSFLMNLPPVLTWKADCCSTNR